MRVLYLYFDNFENCLTRLFGAELIAHSNLLKIAVHSEIAALVAIFVLLATVIIFFLIYQSPVTLLTVLNNNCTALVHAYVSANKI